MTAEQRLDQLELLVSEALTILDRHTAQLKQLTGAVTNITTLVIKQSENISFLLREHVVIKEDIATLKTDVATLTTDVATLKTSVATLTTDVTTLKADVTALKTDVATLTTDVSEIELMQTEFGSKLDLILAKLN